MTTSTQDRSRIDEFLPNHDFSARYEICINAPALVVYQCLLRSDFSELWLVRVLMTLGSGKRLPHHRVPSDLRRRLQGTGFVMLADDLGDELVIGPPLPKQRPSWSTQRATASKHEEPMSKHDSATKRHRRPKSYKRLDYTARTMAAVKELEEAAKLKVKAV